MDDIRPKKLRRVFAMDFLRIICALLIFMRHSITMFGASYGQSINNLAMDFTSIVMTCFFMISGFSIYYSNYKKDLGNIKEKVNFYMKRAIAILPAYYLVHILWIVFMEDSIKSGLILTPIELLGIQSMYNTLFGILHNGGTWFVSSILFAYFIYPIVQELFKIMPRKVKIGVFLLILFVLLYSSFIINEYALGSTYSNPMYRSLEFILGAMLASLVLEYDTTKSSQKINVLSMSIVVLSSIGLILMVKYKPAFNNIPIYHYSYLPFLSLIMSGGYFLRSSLWEKNKILQYLSSLTYFFFLSQLFVWKLAAFVMEIGGFQRNRHKIMISLALSIALSIMVYELVDKPVRKYLNSVLQRKLNEKQTLPPQAS